jgi:hypothetical protein
MSLRLLDLSRLVTADAVYYSMYIAVWPSVTLSRLRIRSYNSKFANVIRWRGAQLLDNPMSIVSSCDLLLGLVRERTFNE